MLSQIRRDHQKAYTMTVVMTVMTSHQHIRSEGEAMVDVGASGGEAVVHVGASRDKGEGQGRAKELGKGRAKRSKPALPELARSIEETDDEFEEFKDDDNFCAIREAGPQLPDDGSMLSELDLFGLYIDDEVIERLVEGTKQYAEKQKDSKVPMYRKFKQSPLTAEEMRRYIGVLLLLSICSIRSYRQAWNPRSSQVRHTYTLL